MTTKKTGTAKKVTKKKVAKKKPAADEATSPQSAHPPKEAAGPPAPADERRQELLDNQRAILETQWEHGNLLARMSERETSQPASHDDNELQDTLDRIESLRQESLRTQEAIASTRRWIIAVAVIMFALLVLVGLLGTLFGGILGDK